MDNLQYRLTFDLDNKNEVPGENLLKEVKFQNSVEKCCNVWKASLQIFSLCHVWKLLPFLSLNGSCARIYASVIQ